MNKELLQSLLAGIDIHLTSQQAELFETYCLELLEWNKKFNLTAIEEEEEIIIKHFYDSLLGMKIKGWKGNGMLLDMGSGAGFPGIPLKIVNPWLDITLVDSLKKRVGFLEHIIQILGLDHSRAIHGRGEDIGQDDKHREKYDVVVSRAVAKMPVLAEYCLPLVKPGGYFLAYKGPEGHEEMLGAAKAITILGGKEDETRQFLLPPDDSGRTLLAIEKIRNTPRKYPRRAGIPVKKPL